jgi:hypothetical protein
MVILTVNGSGSSLIKIKTRDGDNGNQATPGRSIQHTHIYRSKAMEDGSRVGLK